MPLLKRAIVQASSRSWAGSPDESVAQYQGKPLFIHTLQMLRALSVESLAVMAPEFDHAGGLGAQVAAYFGDSVNVVHAEDASPLRRCLKTCSDLDDDDYILRTNGANFTIPRLLLDRALAALDQKRPDLIKLPDDYSGVYQFEIYRLGALRDAARQIDASSPLNVHPRFFVARTAATVHTVEAEFNEICQDLKHTRNTRSQIALADFHDVREGLSIPIGDMISFHYALALEVMRPPGYVLDIACGNGHGALHLAKAGFRVKGADINAERIEAARTRFVAPNLEFEVMDGDNITLESESCDYVVSFETVEHVNDPARFVTELRRILRPGGMLCISTPQNHFGSIPTTTSHTVEFSHGEFLDLMASSFEILDFKGLKAGTVCFADDPIGANSYVVARR